MPKAIYGRRNRGVEKLGVIGHSAPSYALICPEDKRGKLFILHSMPREESDPQPIKVTDPCCR